IAAEYPDLRCVHIDLDESEVSAGAQHIMEEVSNAGDEENHVAFRGGHRYVPRLIREETATTAANDLHRHSSIRLETSGKTFDELELRTVKRRAPAAGEVEVRVCSAGLNFRDVLGALGMLPVTA